MIALETTDEWRNNWWMDWWMNEWINAGINYAMDGRTSGWIDGQIEFQSARIPMNKWNSQHAGFKRKWVYAIVCSCFWSAFTMRQLVKTITLQINSHFYYSPIHVISITHPSTLPLTHSLTHQPTHPLTHSHDYCDPSQKREVSSLLFID